MERLMQYVWQHGLWRPGELRTVDGRRVSVIDRGQLNTDAGPDFFNAKVKIDGETWIGNIEIHVRASDWHRHGHQQDPAYDSVVLHVVDRDDCRIRRSNGEEIPQMLLQCAPNFREHYDRLVTPSLETLSCGPQLASIPVLAVTDWLTSLGCERLQMKATRIKDLVKACQGNWREAVYHTLARALGFGLNGDAFERLARAVPHKILLRHADSPMIVEGLLFGQAGLIPRRSELAEASLEEKNRVEALEREYEFMQRKFSLLPPATPIQWKMARLRPQNFPYRRIAALAVLGVHTSRFCEHLLDVRTETEAAALFDIKVNSFWERHYSFTGPTPRPMRVLGSEAVRNLIINVVASCQYAFGELYRRPALCEQAVELLESMAPERNNIVRLFGGWHVECRSAFESQALVQLRRSYCETRKCLYCRFGHRLLAEKALRRQDS